MNIKEDFIPISQFSRPGLRRHNTFAVVWHWVANPGTSAQMNRNYFASLSSQSPTQEGARYASAHYVIGLGGEIVQCIPTEEIAFHVGSSQKDPASGKIYTNKARELFGIKYTTGIYTPNYMTIGIEFCHPDWMGKPHPETYESAIELTVRLFREYNITLTDPKRQLIRHYDVVGWKRCHLWYCDHPDEFEYAREEVRRKL